MNQLKTSNPIFQWLLSLVFLLLLAACAPTVIDSSEPTKSLPVSAEVEGEAAAVIPETVCTVVSSQDRKAALADSPFGLVSDEDWQRGAEDPIITIVEYSDFQCPYCAALTPVLAELEKRYEDKLSLVYRHFPLIGTQDEPIHDKATLAAQASEAAGMQDAFWEMHDHLFATQFMWADLSLDNFEDFLAEAAFELGLDTAQFMRDLLSDDLVALAEDAWTNGQEIGVTGTPFLIINGFPYQGPRDIFSLDAIIQLELLRERQFSECPSFDLDMTATYTAILKTDEGDIIIHLLPEIAPIAVNSFVFLAENDWFDNVTFHRVLPGFIAQAGDPTGTGYGGPGYAFEIETSGSYVFDRAGLFAMANSGPTSNGSQFFITLGPADHLNDGFTIFGEVLDGMDVVESLTARDPSQSNELPPGSLILDVIIEAN